MLHMLWDFDFGSTAAISLENRISSFRGIAPLSSFTGAFGIVIQAA